MIAAKCKDAKSAQEIEVAITVTIEQILSLPALEADVITDGFENPDKLFVQISRVQSVALELAIREHLRNV